MQPDGTNVCKAAGEQRTKPQRNHAPADHSRARQRYVHDRSLEAQTPRLVWHHRRDTAEYSTYIHVHTCSRPCAGGQQVDNTSTAEPSTVRCPQVLRPICLWSSGRWVPGFDTWRFMSPGFSHDDIQCLPFLDAHVGAGRCCLEASMFRSWSWPYVASSPTWLWLALTGPRLQRGSININQH